MKKTIITIAFVTAVLLLINSSLYIVKTDQYGILTRFGKVTGTDTTAGLKIKLPYPVDQIYFIDKKIKIQQPEPLEVFLSDEQNVVKNVTVEYYILWYISDPLKYFETLRDEGLARIRLENNLRSIISNNLGQYSLNSFISINKEDLKSEEISKKLTNEATIDFSNKYGISIKKVDINRIILPEQNKNKVFERMVSERGRISNRYRAEGEEQAKIILSEANREKSILLSEAKLNAQKLIAEAEAEAAAIYAEAFNKNPEFYKFWRNLKSFEESYSSDSTFILSTDDPLLTDGIY
jgi:membrane protease subunit HflC